MNGYIARHPRTELQKLHHYDVRSPSMVSIVHTSAGEYIISDIRNPDVSVESLCLVSFLF